MKALIVAGEASGDLYGSKLALELQRRIPHFHPAGMGGSRMKEAGVELLFNHEAVSVVGIFEVFSKLLHIREAYSRLKHWILQQKPDFAVLIDFPDFNFRIARLLKKQNIKVFYFISPQVWAWRKKRIFFLKDHVNLMICVLPFEVEMYEEAGVPVVYVGHPLVELVQEELSRQTAPVRKGSPLVGIMPGSREVEVRRHLPILIEAASLIRKQRDAETLLIWPPWLPSGKYGTREGIRLVCENRYAAMQACDLLIVASGTSTLEAAILGVPLLIVYRVGNISWQLGKLLVRVPYYGLVNWIARERKIPEFIQGRMLPPIVAAAALELLENDERRLRMKSDLHQIVKSLGPPGAMGRAADAILQRL